MAVDNVITVREMARLLKEANIDLSILDEEEYDTPLGEATGAGHIFGTTGGVMEAALRSVSYLLDKTEIENVEFKSVRGFKGIKEAKIEIQGKTHTIAVAQGLANVSEVMTCPGGCINGGGQPLVSDYVASKVDYKKLRANALYKADKKSKYRKSHENPEVKKLYKEFLEKPNGKKAHELLHTSYNKQNVYVGKEEI